MSESRVVSLPSSGTGLRVAWAVIWSGLLFVGVVLALIAANIHMDRVRKEAGIVPPEPAPVVRWPAGPMPDPLTAEYVKESIRLNPDNMTFLRGKRFFAFGTQCRPITYDPQTNAHTVTLKMANGLIVVTDFVGRRLEDLQVMDFPSYGGPILCTHGDLKHDEITVWIAVK